MPPGILASSAELESLAPSPRSRAPTTTATAAPPPARTDPSGACIYTAAGSASRTLRFAYACSACILPAQSTVSVVVPAVSALRVSRRRVLNGKRVMFSGQVRSTPIPIGGKVIQLEVLLSGRWQRFRTARTEPSGRWALPYKFARTRGVQWYRFRVELPREAGYPFGVGASKSIRVRVKGAHDRKSQVKPGEGTHGRLRPRSFATSALSAGPGSAQGRSRAVITPSPSPRRRRRVERTRRLARASSCTAWASPRRCFVG